MMVHMDITPYVDSLRLDLEAAAEAGGDDITQAAERLVLALAPATRLVLMEAISQAAERLVVALAPATRLVLMEAISQAAAEITAELPSGGVDVRLDGRDLAFVVHAPPIPSTKTKYVARIA